MKILQRPLILTGIKHCGKTTQGKRLAARLEVPFFDTDGLIQKREGLSPRQIYTSLGKEKFLQAEKDACAELLREQSAPCITATGGGICENHEAVQMLKSFGTVIFLKTKEETAADRIVREAVFSKEKNGQIKNLPAYIAVENPQTEKDVRDIFHRFYERRSEQYEQIADIVVTMQAASKEFNTEKILRAAGLL